jgi:NADH-quinone oxidoreductase subunit A
MEHLAAPILPVFLFLACLTALGVGLLIAARIVRPGRPGQVTRMPYESGMDPIHDTHRRFDVRFHLVAIAFLVFDVELLFLYPWAVVAGQNAHSLSDAPAQISMNAAEAKDKPPAASQPPVRQTPVARPIVADSHVMFAGAMVFVVLLTLGYVYDWRKGVFQWR